MLVAESEPETRGFLERELPRDGFRIARLGGPLDLVLAGDLEVAGHWVERAPVIVLGRERSGTVDCIAALRRVVVMDKGKIEQIGSPDDVYESPATAFVHSFIGESIELPVLIAEGVVRLGDRPLRLAQKEYELLLALAREPDRVFTKAELLRDVWGYRVPGRTRTLDSHASRLRRKLRQAGAGELVDNVWGVGYRLRGPLVQTI